MFQDLPRPTPTLCTQQWLEAQGSYPARAYLAQGGEQAGFLPAACGGLSPARLLERPASCTTKDKTDTRSESLDIGDWATGP